MVSGSVYGGGDCHRAAKLFGSGGFVDGVQTLEEMAVFVGLDKKINRAEEGSMRGVLVMELSGGMSVQETSLGDTVLIAAAGLMKLLCHRIAPVSAFDGKQAAVLGGEKRYELACDVLYRGQI